MKKLARELRPNERLVLTEIRKAQRADQHWNALTIAAALDCHHFIVYRAIDNLKQLGVLVDGLQTVRRPGLVAVAVAA